MYAEKEKTATELLAEFKKRREFIMKETGQVIFTGYEYKNLLDAYFPQD